MDSEALATDDSKVLELFPDGQRLLMRAGVGWRDGLVGKATVGIGRDSQAGHTLSRPAQTVQTDGDFSTAACRKSLSA
jgi:hypothetical protein